MKIFWKDLVAFSPDGGGAGAAAGGGASGGQSDGGGQQNGGQQGGGSQGGNLADAAARAAANQQPANGQQQQNGQQQANGQQASQAYYPEGLPDTFRGTNDRETIDKLAKDIADRPKPPAAAKDYKYEFTEDFTKKYGDLKDDPVLPMFNEVAHKHGLSNKAAQGIVTDLFDGLAKAGLIPEAIDMDKELLKLEPNEPDPVRRATKAGQRVTAIATTLKGLETRGVLTKADNARLSLMFMDAANVAAFEKVMKLIPAEHGMQGGGTTPDGRSPYQKQLDAFYPSMTKTN